jgi:hypothetical protein
LTHPLYDLFVHAARGWFPDADGGVDIVPSLPGELGCSVAFTGRAVVATDNPGLMCSFALDEVLP